MEAKKKGVVKAAILTTVVLVWSLGISAIEPALAEGGGNNEICSFLGNDPKPSILDQDIFEFNGTKDEKITVTLIRMGFSCTAYLYPKASSRREKGGGPQKEVV
jgi:hypothetical protein